MKKSFKKATAFLLALVMCVSATGVNAYAEETATAAGEQSGWDGVTTVSNYAGENFNVTYTLASYWNGGYNASIKVENTGSSVIENWYLSFALENNLTSIWNAEVVSNEDGRYVVKNAGWNADIPVGGSVEFGLSVNENFVGFPSSYKLLGESTQVQEEAYSVEYILDSDWGSGFTARVLLTNHTEEVLEDWTLKFDFDREITSIWNAEIESHENNHYVIKNAGYNANIATGSAISFGFNGEGGSKEEEPTNCQLSKYWGAYEESEQSGNVNLKADSDNDNVPDYVENLFETEINKIDTDDDGLSDYIEIYMVTLDPTNKDTDGNGILDGDADSDNDGLSNLDELAVGTYLYKDDSDHDGLNDFAEVNNFKTDPMKEDTDGDNALDGWEVTHNYDPLVYNGEFLVTVTAQDESVSISIATTTGGENVTTLTAKPIVRNPFFDSSMPGYIGSAFDLSIDGSVSEATIAFTFDETFLQKEGFNPVIYYYNEETQLLEELPTTVVGNVATTTVSHFSTYILLNKEELDKAWEAEIKPPEYTSEYTGLDVVFVIDSSGSMSWNDGSKLRLQAAKKFVDKLGENDRAAIVDFDSSAYLIQSFTSDHELLHAAINRVNDSGGTSLSAGISLAISQFTSSSYTRDDAYKYVIFLTDGDGSYSASYTTAAKNNSIIIYTIGLGSGVRSAVLKNIANGTGGKYFFASTATELGDIYDEVSVETVDYSTDSNGDGISDYYTKLLCEGTLKLGTGRDNPFKGYDYDTVQKESLSDFDNDGLLNGQELIVKQNESTNKVYVYMMSNPTAPDSDYDGIDDCDEQSQAKCHSNEFKANVFYSTADNTFNTTSSFIVDYSLFFGDNTKFYQELSVLASLYALDMYNPGWLELKEGTTGSSKEVNGVSLGEIFGMNDGRNYSADELLTKYAANDNNGQIVDVDDVSEVYIGHRLVSYAGERREIFFLTVRGTNGTSAEWSSNFDIGADTDGYYGKTGEHPDWRNRENHKGFDVAATRILKAFDEYVTGLENDGKIDMSAERSIFVVGHSRGAAIANILGAHFENDVKYNSYVYTMASPYTTTDTNAPSYQTIFNIVNTDDLVTELPLHDWGFYKYGKILSVSVDEKYDDSKWFSNATNSFEAAFGMDYNGNSYVESAVGAFKDLADNREEFYEIDESGDGTVQEGGIYSLSKGYIDFIQLITDGKMDKYCQVKKDNGWFGTYTIKVTYCPAYVAQNIANLAGPINGYEVLDWIGVDLKGKYSKARQQFALASGKIQVKGVGPGGMECPHMPGTYYLISYNTDLTEYKQVNQTIK